MVMQPTMATRGQQTAAAPSRQRWQSQALTVSAAVLLLLAACATASAISDTHGQAAAALSDGSAGTPTNLVLPSTYE